MGSGWWKDLRDLANALCPGVSFGYAGYHYLGSVQVGMLGLAAWCIGVLILERILRGREEKVND